MRRADQVSSRVEITHDEFVRDRAQLLELASAGVVVVVLGDHGQLRTIFSTPRVAQPMRFD